MKAEDGARVLADSATHAELCMEERRFLGPGMSYLSPIKCGAEFLI